MKTEKLQVFGVVGASDGLNEIYIYNIYILILILQNTLYEILF